MKLSKLTQIITLLSFGGLPAFSAIRIVNPVPDVPNCPGEYATIQDGVDAANAGDTVYVCAGTYIEQVNITRNITLAGQTGATVMPSNMANNAMDLFGGPIAAAIFVSGVSNAIVSGLIVDGTNNGVNNGCGTNVVGIYYQNAGGTIAHNAIRNFELPGGLFGCQVGFDIYAEAIDNATKTLAITQNSAHDYQKAGIEAYSTSYVFLIQYNTVRGIGPTGAIGQNGIEIDGAAPGTSVIGNNVSGDEYICPPDTCYTASGILNFANNVVVSKNTVTSTDVAIDYEADNATISANSLSGSTSNGIYFMDSNLDAGSTIAGNTATSDPYAIELVGASNNVSITGNTVIEAQVAISNDNASAITIAANKYFDVPLTIQNGAAAAATARKRPAASRFR